MEILYWVLLIIGGFLLGGVMFCELIPKKFLHKDICEISVDNNPGAFNVFKHCGKEIGLPCLLLDILKGFIPVFIASLLMETNNIAFSFVMIAPALGHAIGLFNNFKGGKCIAVSFGVMAGALPVTWIAFAVLATLYILFSTLIKIKPNRVRSIVVYVLFGIITGVTCGVLKFSTVAIGCALISLIVIIKHLRVITEFETEKYSDYEEEKVIDV